MDKKTKTVWEIINYGCLGLLIFGNILVGYQYIPAQIAFSIANLVSVIRDFKMKLPTSNKVRDIFFFILSVGLIVIYLLRGGN